MLKKTITYTDFEGQERTEDFYFNLSEAEIVEREYSIEGGLSKLLMKMIRTEDKPALMSEMRKLILGTYGEKSADGRRFIKSEELSTAFSQTNAYSVLLMELISSDNASTEFVRGIMPAGSVENAEKAAETDPDLKAIFDPVKKPDNPVESKDSDA